MRVYIPATFAMVTQLRDAGSFTARSGYGFAVTPALREYFTAGDEDDFAEYAFDEASRASMRLLAIGDEEQFQHRRVVISVDVPDDSATSDPELGEAVVKLSPAEISFDSVAAIHIDVESSEEATAKAVKVIDEADLGEEDAELIVGDALDNFLAWYDPSELNMLVELL